MDVLVRAIYPKNQNPSIAWLKGEKSRTLEINRPRDSSLER